GKRWAAWEKLEHTKEETAVTNRISALNKERQGILDKQADLELKGQQLSPAEVVRLREVEFEIGLGQFEYALRFYEQQRDYKDRPWKDRADQDVRRRIRVGQFRDVLNGFAVVLTEARNERLQELADTWPKLPQLCVDGRDLLEGDIDEAYDAASRTALV